MMAGPVQPLARKTPAVPRAGFAPGDVPRSGAEGGAAQPRYVHNIATSFPESGKVIVFKGTTAQGAVIGRAEKRDKTTRLVVNSLNRCGREVQAKALATCGEWYDVWHKKVPGRFVGTIKLLPCPCNSMFCPECANRRSVPLQRKLLKMVNRPKRSYWFLTLTIPNQQRLEHRDIVAIGKQFSKLWKSWVFQEVEGPNGKPFKMFGGVRSIETTYNQGFRYWREPLPDGKSVQRSAPDAAQKGWHPHIHVLFEGPSKLPWWWLILLKAKWAEITGDGRYVHLEPAYGKTKRGKKMHNRLNRRGLREVCKYVTKCADFAGDHFLVDEFLTAFKNVRRVQCFGSFQGEKAREFDRQPGEDDDLDVDIQEAEKRMSDEGYSKLPIRARTCDTELLPDGTRQLTFAFLEIVCAVLETQSPPFWELEPEEVKVDDQRQIGFSGALPENSEPLPSLFEGAA